MGEGNSSLFKLLAMSVFPSENNSDFEIRKHPFAQACLLLHVSKVNNVAYGPLVYEQDSFQNELTITNISQCKPAFASYKAGAQV